MIGDSSATLKSGFLVLFGPNTTRLLYKFEKKKSKCVVPVTCTQFIHFFRLHLVLVLQFTVTQNLLMYCLFHC